MRSSQTLEISLTNFRSLLPALVVNNAAALYGVQIGRKLIPLASIPYLARVLGPEGWGKVAFVTAMAELIAILIEFGFCLSATRLRHSALALDVCSTSA